jgi:hypothetical protein
VKDAIAGPVVAPALEGDDCVNLAHGSDFVPEHRVRGSSSPIVWGTETRSVRWPTIP